MCHAIYDHLEGLRVLFIHWFIFSVTAVVWTLRLVVFCVSVLFLWVFVLFHWLGGIWLIWLCLLWSDHIMITHTHTQSNSCRKPHSSSSSSCRLPFFCLCIEKNVCVWLQRWPQQPADNLGNPQVTLLPLPRTHTHYEHTHTYRPSVETLPSSSSFSKWTFIKHTAIFSVQNKQRGSSIKGGYFKVCICKCLDVSLTTLNRGLAGLVAIKLVCRLLKVHPLLVVFAPLLRHCALKNLWKLSLCDVSKGNEGSWPLVRPSAGRQDTT